MSQNSLTEFVDSLCDESHLRVQEDLGDGFVRLRTEEAERRQAAHDIRSSEDIVIEMLRNSRDAGSHVIFLAVNKEGQKRSIIVIDDGAGIPERIQDLIFEPRVTSKLDSMHMDKWGVHGRGMALYSVKVNAKVARVVYSAPGKGSSIVVRTDCSSLSERSDQSTFPQFVMDASRKVTVRGPRNIIRTACEFALEHRRTLSVYVGSPADIAATLYAYGRAAESASALAFGANKENASAVKSLAYAADAAELSQSASKLGIDISDRTSYRILQGKIKPLDSLLELIEQQGIVGYGAEKPQKKAKRSKSALIAINNGDMEAFQHQVEKAFKQIASAYYLNGDVEASIRIDSGHLKVSIPLIEED